MRAPHRGRINSGPHRGGAAEQLTPSRRPTKHDAVTDAERMTELELELMAQRELLETLDSELTTANNRVEFLEKRVERLERQLEDVSTLLEAPSSDKPPHY